MLFNVFEQLVRCEELRIPANNLEILVGVIGEINKILDYRNLSLRNKPLTIVVSELMPSISLSSASIFLQA